MGLKFFSYFYSNGIEQNNFDINNEILQCIT
jgi:hypothetical protein